MNTSKNEDQKKIDLLRIIEKMVVDRYGKTIPGLTAALYAVLTRDENDAQKSVANTDYSDLVAEKKPNLFRIIEKMIIDIYGETIPGLTAALYAVLTRYKIDAQKSVVSTDYSDLIAEKDRWPDDSLVGRLATALAQSERNLADLREQSKVDECSELAIEKTSDPDESFGQILLTIEILKIEDSESWEIPEPYYYLSLDNADVLECAARDKEWLLNEIHNGDMFTEVADSIRDALAKSLGA